MNDILENHANEYLLVYTDCRFVAGSKNALLHDMTRQEVYKIPQSYVRLADSFRTKTISEIHQESTPENRENIHAFIDFLLAKKLATFVTDITVFPEMELEWHEPNRIKTALIDYQHNFSDYDLNATLEQLNTLECDHLEIRTYTPFPITFFNQLLTWLEPLFFRSLEFVARDHEAIDLNQLEEIMRKKHVINKVTLTHSQQDRIITIKRTHNSVVHIVQTCQQVDSNKHCGIINPQSLFSPNIKQFSENHNFNSCLNRKIGIDKYGEIKNCPSMQQSFGNVKTTALETVVDTDGFQAKWKIHKGQTDVCNTCEFRYMCTDCRAFVQQPEDAYSKPLKCGYEPSQGIWTDWIKADISQKGITYYNLDDLVQPKSVV